MSSPEDGDYIGDDTYDPVFFFGEADYSGQTIRIQVKDADGYWVTFATTTSKTRWGFTSWSTNAVVPHWEASPYGSLWMADVRAVTGGGWYTQVLGQATIFAGDGGSY